MEWQKLISTKRLGSKNTALSLTERSAFQIDFDRIVFSSDFRLLQDKTQVFPLPDSDYVRTRLTHSLETSCVGRSLGTIIGKQIVQKHNLQEIHASDFGSTVAAACLAHDIGNPPFGHSGEDCIRHWFNSSALIASLLDSLADSERSDLEYFEGNAQGFRILANIHNPDRTGGMRLCTTTLAAFMKYPQESSKVARKGETGFYKKFGFFQDEKDLYQEVATDLELIKLGDYHWARHPLTYLVEAADDICYCIIDYEDGYNSGLVSYEQLETRFSALIKTGSYAETIDQNSAKVSTVSNRVEFLRAMAIATQIEQCVAVFMDNETAILNGQFKGSLTDDIPAAKTRDAIIGESVQKIYREQRILEIEAAGFEVIPNLLDAFISAIFNDDKHSKKIKQLIPKPYRERVDKLNSNYQKILSIIDYVSGMTDSSAVSLYRKIKGISLPY